MSADLRQKLEALAKEIGDACDQYRGVPPWVAQGWADRIRALASPTDRDAACPHFSATGAEVVRLYRCDGCGEVRDGYVDDRVTDPLGSTPDAPHFVALSGPPVQPEEES